MVNYRYLLFSAVVMLVPGNGRAAEFSEANFAKLSPQERVSFALSCLQSRDLALETFSYKVNVTIRNISTATDKTTFEFPSEKHELIRSGDMSLLHSWVVAKDGNLTQECFDKWDGKERKAIAPREKGDKYPSMLIDSAESIWVTGVGYNLLLGYRMMGFNRITVAKWAGIGVGGNRDSVEVTVDHADKDTLVLIHIREHGYTHYRFWLDPTRDYLPVRFKTWNARDKDEKTYVNWMTDEVLEAKKFGGIFVPMKVIRKSGATLADKHYTQRTYEVEDFTLDRPAPERFKLTIPPDVRVNDKTRNEMYVLHADGSKKFVKFYDPRTGKVVSATQQAADEAAATQPAGSPATQPSATPVSKQPGK